MNTIKSTKPIQRQKIILNEIDNQFNNNLNQLTHLKNNLNRFQSPKPFERYFVWTGIFADQEIISEIDFRNYRDVNFDEFKLKNQNPNKQLINFGLCGAGYFFYYNIYNGNFILNEKEIKIMYKVGENVYQLTDAFNINYNDVITYKEAECNFAPFGKATGSELKSTICEYNFGYKQKLKYNDGTIIKFQPVVHIPINSPMYINIKMVCLNNSLDGELIIMKNGRIMHQEKAPLPLKQAGETNWIVK